MSITLNHTIVPSFDKVESAKFYSRVFGFEYVGAFSHFIVVRVNDTLCLDFDNETQFESHHYAFKVSEREFDDIFARLLAEKFRTAAAPAVPTIWRSITTMASSVACISATRTSTCWKC